ncbi:amidohydrolase [Leucobacter sp. Psy1]|uniref:amidohydrolase n=1 Tax=Leucobacter sp. Psy1 TaxID=2875729 RepID=UPI001CD7FFCF|nr:amidohydrolase [Leucobacter sp. Psy1]UBH07221.1 amidohydrolase [Leucobacter sp. Psy1]
MTDLIIHNARIRTMAPDAEVSAHTAVAIADGKISALGSDAEILSLESDALEVVDARGATLTPGLIDSHLHPVWGAELTVGVDLGGLTDIADVRRALAAEAERRGADEWVRGWNLDYKVFSSGGLDGSIRGDLFDDAVDGRPLALVCYDLHTGVGNAAALAAAGIDGSERFDDASEVVTGADGKPTGELSEIPAYMMLLDRIPGADAATIAQRTRGVLSAMAATGVTGAAVMDGRESTLDVLETIERDLDGLPVRLHIAMWHQPGDGDDRVETLTGMYGRRGDRYAVSMIKIFIDGVIDTGTAWLHEPDSSGESRTPFWGSMERYAEVVRAYHSAGYQVATHSCGDAGVAAVVEVYRSLDGPSANGAPHRIEHLETMTDDDVDAVVESGVIASMQPLHMQWREGDASDSWAVRLGPERMHHGFRVRDVIDRGGHVVLGSDWPVAQNDARLGMAWARLRRLPGDPDAPVFEADQRLSAEETLLAYTRWAAEALGRDDLGIIAPGAVADLALWGDDPIASDSDRLTDIPVLMTTIAGTPVHREESPA